MGKEFTNIVATTEGGTYKQASVGAASQSPNVFDKYASTLISQNTQAVYGKAQEHYAETSKTLSEAAQAVTNAIVLGLSSKWLAISAIKAIKNRSNSIEAKRYDRENLFSLQLGDYFMPLSQTFNLRAKKRLNVCSLVDGVDIIQQTRHEAKMIDCSLRITLRKNQPNLEIVSETQRLSTFNGYLPSISEAVYTGEEDDFNTDLVRSLETFAQFLSDLYENDAVFAIDNQVINDVFGVEYAMISEYNFRPQVSRSTFQFDFTLTEVKITSDTLTVDKTQMR